MHFKPAEPNVNFFSRWVSTGGRWEIGLTQMIFGVRIRLGNVGSPTIALDYCAGASVQWQQDVLRLVMTILLPMTEEAETYDSIRRQFPYQQIKPMFNDPECWSRLQAMAMEVLVSNASTDPIDSHSFCNRQGGKVQQVT